MVVTIAMIIDFMVFFMLNNVYNVQVTLGCSAGATYVNDYILVYSGYEHSAYAPLFTSLPKRSPTLVPASESSALNQSPIPTLTLPS